MCGRYTLTSVDGLIEELSLTQDVVRFAPRYNIAPGERVPVVDNRPRDRRVLVSMRWGLVPYWAKDPAIGHRLINARCETVADKPAFRQALRERRCLIAADGFYEWRHTGKRKTPFYIRRRSRRVLAFAGVWDRWRGTDGTWSPSFAVITTRANALIEPIHDRMPVIVERADQDRWLEPGPVTVDAIADMFAPPGADCDLELFEVSARVNSVANDSPACIEPGRVQQTLF